MVKKSAFTLIELIFAIVVISITVVSLPMMTQVINKGTTANLVQEAIFASATELNEAVSAYWDANSIESGTTLYARVIDVNQECNTTTRLMPGHVNEPLHRRCLDSNNTTPLDANPVAGNTLNDMAHPRQNIFVNPTTDQSGYKKQYFSQLTVTRGVLFGGTINPNIKRLTIIITDENNNTITSLKTYSANIGEVDYYKKAYQ